jgi:hypothetical protein
VHITLLHVGGSGLQSCAEMSFVFIKCGYLPATAAALKDVKCSTVHECKL